MKLFLLFLGVLSLGSRAYSEECDEDAAKQCVLPLIMSLQEDEVNCDVMFETRNCLMDLVERCAEEDEKEAVQDILNELEAKIVGICGDGSDEYDEYAEYDEEERTKQTLECASEYTLPTLTKCSQLIVSPLGNVRNEEIDKRCRAFMKIASCVSGRIAELCGEEVKESIYVGMISGLRSPRFSDLLDSPRCAKAIARAED